MNEEGSERGRKLRVGIFVLVGVAAFLGMVYALGARARLFEPRFTIHADFTEVGGLVEGATVRLAGVLTSEQSTASAKRFVAAMDKLSRVVDQPSPEDGVLPALMFDPKYRAMLDDAQVLAHNLRDVSDRLAGGRGTLGSLVKDEPGDAGIRQTSRDLQAAMANLREITEKIKDGEGTVGALIADPTVYERLVSILDGASRSFLLRGLLRGLGGGAKDGAKDGISRDGASRDGAAKPRE